MLPEEYNEPISKSFLLRIGLLEIEKKPRVKSFRSVDVEKKKILEEHEKVLKQN
jgi:hypothetical protein